jgi:hypothetical protein
MNLNRFLNNAANVLVRRLVNLGIDRGLGWLGRRGGSGATTPPGAKPPACDARALAKRARLMARIARRFGR